MNHDDLLQELQNLDIQPVDNTVVAARLQTRPGPVVTGLAPAEVYDSHQSGNLSAFPVMSKFEQAMPAPAQLPDIQAQFRSNFSASKSQSEPDPVNNPTIKPDLLP